jgi:hypothetical protein
MTPEREQSTTQAGVKPSFALLHTVVAAGEPVGVREPGRRTALRLDETLAGNPSATTW